MVEHTEHLLGLEIGHLRLEVVPHGLLASDLGHQVAVGVGLVVFSVAPGGLLLLLAPQVSQGLLVILQVALEVEPDGADVAEEDVELTSSANVGTEVSKQAS